MHFVGACYIHKYRFITSVLQNINPSVRSLSTCYRDCSTACASTSIKRMAEHNIDRKRGKILNSIIIINLTIVFRSIDDS